MTEQNNNQPQAETEVTPPKNHKRVVAGALAAAAAGAVLAGGAAMLMSPESTNAAPETSLQKGDEVHVIPGTVTIISSGERSDEGAQSQMIINPLVREEDGLIEIGVPQQTVQEGSYSMHIVEQDGVTDVDWMPINEAELTDTPELYVSTVLDIAPDAKIEEAAFEGVETLNTHEGVVTPDALRVSNDHISNDPLAPELVWSAVPGEAETMLEYGIVGYDISHLAGTPSSIPGSEMTTLTDQAAIDWLKGQL